MLLLTLSADKGVFVALWDVPRGMDVRVSVKSVFFMPVTERQFRIVGTDDGLTEDSSGEEAEGA